ncbi:MAG: hypothetical protein HQL22_10100 [Candidatus Omnitrophica bacterium]|nr:hypothetical protein [Candidatus Omnitrophota bacterium]
MVQFKFSDNNSFGGVGKVGGKTAPKLTLSVASVRAFLLGNKIGIFCIGVVLLTLGGVWQFLSTQMAKIDALNTDIQQLSEKESPAKKLKSASADSETLFENIPYPLLEARFISYFTLLANKRNVQITSITPPQTVDNGYFRRTTTQLLCAVNSFQDALLLLDDIEQSEYALKVDSLKFQQSSRSDNGVMLRGRNPAEAMSKGGASSKLEITMTVSSIEILDNEKTHRKQ